MMDTHVPRSVICVNLRNLCDYKQRSVKKSKCGICEKGEGHTDFSDEHRLFATHVIHIYRQKDMMDTHVPRSEICVHLRNLCDL